MLLLITALCMVQLILARQHLVRAVADVRAAGIQSPWDLLRSSARQTARSHLLHAQRETLAARSDLQLWSPLLRRLNWLPGIGSQLAAAPATADTSYYAVRSAIHLIDGLMPLLSALHVSTPLSPRIVPALQRGHGQFSAARDDADRAISALASLPEQSITVSFGPASIQLHRDLPLLRTTSSWLALAPDLLGASGSSTYLVAFQDSHELRSTGGFIAAADYVTLRRGRVSTTFSSSALSHEIMSVLLPLPEAVYTPETRWIFRDCNWSPDFPLSARLERWFYGEDTGRWADGVIDLNEATVDDILRAVGPLYIPQYELWVNANNVDELTQRYVNGPYKGPVRVGPHDTVRKQFLGDVIGAILKKVPNLTLHEWTRLGTAAARAVSQGDILLYHRHTAVEAAIRQINADGRVRYRPGDYLYVVDDNRSYDKLNPYVHEWGSYRASIRTDGWIDATLTLHYHVAPSPAGLEGIGPGYGLWGTKHDYQDFIRIYAPAGSILHSLSGVDEWAPARAYGLTQFAGRLMVRQGQTASVTAHYSVPPNSLAGSGFTRYRLTVQHQPAGNLAALNVTVTAPHHVTLSANRHQEAVEYRDVIPLERSSGLSLSIHGGLSPRLITLAPPPAHPDPYLPWSSLYDARHPL